MVITQDTPARTVFSRLFSHLLPRTLKSSFKKKKKIFSPPACSSQSRLSSQHSSVESYVYLSHLHLSRLQRGERCSILCLSSPPLYLTFLCGLLFLSLLEWNSSFSFSLISECLKLIHRTPLTHWDKQGLPACGVDVRPSQVRRRATATRSVLPADGLSLTSAHAHILWLVVSSAQSSTVHSIFT